MTGNEANPTLTDTSMEIVDQESYLRDEVRNLKQHITDMYRAWISGKPPPPLPLSYFENPSTTSILAQTQHIPPSYPLAEQEEMSRKLKSMEQSLRNLQGLRGFKSVSYKDLCMFPDVQLPPGFKIPKFDMYDGRGDPMAHLRRYCNQLRGVGGKNELLMAYFSQSLTGIAAEWYANQDISQWHIWEDMAQNFIQQFQYNIDMIPDKKSLMNLKKKPTESFKEFAIRWREQAARVRPTMKECEMLETFIQVQEEAYYQFLLPALGKPFSEAIKIGEIFGRRS
ncbi:uncharacterized protein LOC132054010 [Lycium ferocissimum]|uniref:uncharacterized protein LOC132054010 n=1 Tax=Lycium ferocissimum TaxID=112874 RepID=UPI002815B374|nr:uncharacterized protein LOC132054010 [Lycium ferocissimum]